MYSGVHSAKAAEQGKDVLFNKATTTDQQAYQMQVQR
jgi:hypothetical protein